MLFFNAIFFATFSKESDLMQPPNEITVPGYPIRSIDEQDIMWIDFGGISKISVSHVVGSYHWHMNTDNKPKAVINNIPHGQTVSLEAIKIMESKPIVDVIICSAIVVDSKMLKYLSRLYLPLHSPPYPVRLFNNTEDALAWVLATRNELASKNQAVDVNKG